LPPKKAATRFTRVGYVQKPHALKGEVKAVFDYRFSQKKLKTLYIGDESPLPFTVMELNPIGQNLYILKTGDCNDRTQAEQITGMKIYVPEADFDKYFESDFAAGLIGWKAVADGNTLGIIDDVYVLPQQHVAQVMVNGREVLIPLNDETIVRVEKAKKILVLKLPNGLLDL
jgi:16S rRNA processing protein RimM